MATLKLSANAHGNWRQTPQAAGGMACHLRPGDRRSAQGEEGVRASQDRRYAYLFSDAAKLSQWQSGATTTHWRADEKPTFCIGDVDLSLWAQEAQLMIHWPPRATPTR